MEIRSKNTEEGLVRSRILEIVSGRSLLGYLESVKDGFKVVYCDILLGYVIKNEDGYCVTDEFKVVRYEIVDDGEIVNDIFGRRKRKKRKVTKILEGGEERYRIMYHYTPGVVHGYVYRRTGEGYKLGE